MKLLDELVRLDLDRGTTAYALKIRERIKLPMQVVLDNAWPGDSIADKVRRLGITRQTYYGWVEGMFRPDATMARKLARATGFDEVAIRGQKLLRDKAP